MPPLNGRVISAWEWRYGEPNRGDDLLAPAIAAQRTMVMPAMRTHDAGASRRRSSIESDTAGEVGSDHAAINVTNGARRAACRLLPIGRLEHSARRLYRCVAHIRPRQPLPCAWLPVW